MRSLRAGCAVYAQDAGDLLPGNATTHFDDVALVSVASVLPSRVTTSDDIEDRLAPALQRLKLKPGLLRRVAGVNERRNWAEGESSDEATIAAASRLSPKPVSIRARSGSSSTPR